MSMTIKQARKLLGKMAESLSDEELEKEIQSANLLKELFFILSARNQKTKRV